MVGGHVLAENGCATASREDPAYVIDARRMVSEVVSDNPVGGANRKRERNRNLLTWRQPLLNSFYPPLDQVVLRTCDANLVDAVLYENDVPNHRATRAEFPDPVPNHRGCAALREEENWENFRIKSRGVSLIGAFDHHFGGGPLGFVPSQQQAGRIDADVDPVFLRNTYAGAGASCRTYPSDLARRSRLVRTRRR